MRLVVRLRAWARAHPARAAAATGALVVLLLWIRRLGGGEAARPAPERVAPVVVETARTGDIAVHLDGIGTVVPRAMVTVRTRVDGELVAVHFREGQTVKDGDPLAEIDPRPFQVQLTQAQGQLARDEALLANAKVDLSRYRGLAKDDAIPEQQLATQQALVRQYEAALAIDHGQIDAAKLNLDYSRITAPFDGRIGLRLVDPGNIVHATDTGGLAVLTQLRPIDVVFTIPEDSLPEVLARLRTGEKLTVDAFDRAIQNKLATGTLLTVDNTIDPTTGTVRLKAEFPNDDDALFPNQFVNARLELDVRRGATLTPEAAIQRGTQGTFVWVVKDDDTVEMRPVKIGVVEGPEASVDGGVTPGERVVVDGAEGLRAGGKVSVGARRAPPSRRDGTAPPAAAGTREAS